MTGGRRPRMMPTECCSRATPSRARAKSSNPQKPETARPTDVTEAGLSQRAEMSLDDAHAAAASRHS